MYHGFAERDPAPNADANAAHAAQGNDAAALMAQMVGERKKVLYVGCRSSALGRALLDRQCDVAGIAGSPLVAEEARRFCARVVVADLDTASLPELFPEARFDAVVFSDTLCDVREPLRLLDESRAVLDENGFALAAIPNVSHGAVRLALLGGDFDYRDQGVLAESRRKFFTARSAEELFIGAGFRIERIERITLGLFENSPLLPRFERSDFDEKLLAKIEADPESSTLEFVVKALPLTNEAKYRSIFKRFLFANTELAASNRLLARREIEFAQARDHAGELQLKLDKLAAYAEELHKIGEERLDELDRLRNFEKIAAERQSALNEAAARAAGLEKIAEERQAALNDTAARLLDLEKIAAERLAQNSELADGRIALEAQLAELDKIASARLAEHEALAAAHKSLETEFAALKQLVNERNDQIAKINKIAAERLAEHSALAAAHKALESQISGLNQLANERNDEIAELKKIAAERLDRSNELAVARDEYVLRLSELERSSGEKERELRDRLAAAEQRLSDQITDALEEARTENERLASLIDTVQSSHFWRLKRFLNRVRGVFR